VNSNMRPGRRAGFPAPLPAAHFLAALQSGGDGLRSSPPLLADAAPRREQGWRAAPGKGRRQRGFTLIEVSITLGVVSVLMLIVYSIMDQTMRADDVQREPQRSGDHVAARDERAADRDRAGAPGGFRKTRTAPRIDPHFRSPPSIRPGRPRCCRCCRAATTRWRPTPPRATPATRTSSCASSSRCRSSTTTTATSHTPDVEFLADRYCFEYLSSSRPTPRGDFRRGTFTLDLMQSTSIQYADYFQLSSMTSTQLRPIATKIMPPGITARLESGPADRQRVLHRFRRTATSRGDQQREDRTSRRRSPSFRSCAAGGSPDDGLPRSPSVRTNCPMPIAVFAKTNALAAAVPVRLRGKARRTPRNRAR